MKRSVNIHMCKDALHSARAALCARCAVRALRSVRPAFCARCVLRALRSARAAFCARCILRARPTGDPADRPEAYHAQSFPRPVNFDFLFFS